MKVVLKVLENVTDQNKNVKKKHTTVNQKCWPRSMCNLSFLSRKYHGKEVLTVHQENSRAWHSEYEVHWAWYY